MIGSASIGDFSRHITCNIHMELLPTLPTIPLLLLLLYSFMGTILGCTMAVEE